MERNQSLSSQNIVAVVWDFDKTLIPGSMQTPLFLHYGMDERNFWDEVNRMPDMYARRGIRVSPETCYLNHLLSHIRSGKIKGLNNARLRELGRELVFHPGLPDFFRDLRQWTSSKPVYSKHEIQLEHYIVSTGLAEMIRGSRIAAEVEDVFACEFVEDPLPPGFPRQPELAVDTSPVISQIGFIVDNTIKTRFIFEINKGSNKNPAIDVNAVMHPQDRRVPLQNMIYVADGPSDVPVFSVVKRGGGRNFAVYDPANEAEFAQNDALQQDGRVDSFGPADYLPGSQTHRWLKLQVERICDRIVRERESAFAERVRKPPTHTSAQSTPADEPASLLQKELFD